MSWLNKLKKIFTEEKVIEEKKTEMVTLEQLYLKVDAKIKEISEKSSQLKKEIINRINQLEAEIKSPLESLEKTDISGKKEHDKIKIIVTENLDLYVTQLKRLISNIRNIGDLEIKECIKQLFLILNDFNRTSRIPFEKANILIGKELQAVKDIVNNFLKDIAKITDNKRLFDEMEISHKLSLLLSELTKNKNYEEEINQKKAYLEKELKRKDEEYALTKQKIDAVKNSSDYKKDMQEKEERKEKIKKLENALDLLKQKINFKLLAKHFHHDNKKSQIILSYANNFKSSVKNDSSLAIIDFAKEAQGIELSSLKELRDKMINHPAQLITQTEKEIGDLEASLKELDSNTAGIKANIENESKKKEKLITKREKIISEIKNLSESLFPDIKIE